MGHTFGVRVDGASPRGLWPPAGGGLCSLRSGGRQAVDSMDFTERNEAVLFSHGRLLSIKKRPTFSRGRFSYFIVSGSTGKIGRAHV